MARVEYSILGDNPVAAGDDRLGFRTFVEPFAERLIASRSNTPFTVGVFADWGQGKTTVLQMLQASLEEKGCPTVWFDPWKYDSRDAVWKGLALTLVAEVRRNDSLMREIRRKKGTLKSLLAEGLLSRLVGSRWAGKIVKAVETEPWSPSLLHEFESNLSTLFAAIDPGRGGLDKPLVLFVDDLDRCLPEPALAVLEALKLVLNKPGLIVVMGIAESELARAIAAGYGRELHLDKTGGALDPQWGRNYLRKMIQMPFPLPVVTDDSFRDYVGDCLKRSGVAAALRDDARWHAVIREACEGNLREVKRFINHYISEMDKAEANLAARARERERTESAEEEAAAGALGPERLLDPPRVAFILLLDWRFREFLNYVRRRVDDPELLIRYQLAFLQSGGTPENAKDEERTFYENGRLAELFRGCLGAPAEGSPLVAPFGARADFERYLQFGKLPAAPALRAEPLELDQGREAEAGREGSEEEPPKARDSVSELLSSARALVAHGEYQAARDQLARALVLARAQEDHTSQAMIVLQLAQIERLSGRQEAASAASREAVEIARGAGDRLTEAAALRSFADAMVSTNPQDSLRMASEAARISWESGDLLGAAAAHEIEAAALEATRDYGAAHESYKTALEIQERLDNRPLQLSVLLHMARVVGDRETALAYCSKARAIAGTLGDRQAQLRVERTAGEVLARRGDLLGADQAYGNAALMAEALGSPRDAGWIFAEQGAVLERSGYLAEALLPYQRALEKFHEADDEREFKRIERAINRLEKQDQQSG